MYTFDIGSCATAGDVADHILFPIGTSFVTVADFTAKVDYTEGGVGGGTSLGFPTSSSVIGGSIITVFPITAKGLVVTQNITVTGSTYSNSAITMNVKVVNTNENPQEVGIRYLWDPQVGGFDGAWLQEYDGATAGAITGYETVFSPPPANFTSYAIGGCSQGSVIPPPYICDPSNFGAGSGAFSVFGSISSGPGATTPARFVYGWWGSMFDTAYGYTPNPLHEVGSYVQSLGGAQDSALLYYFSNDTIPGTGGVLSDQADVTTNPTGKPASVSGLDAEFWKGTFFGGRMSACVSESSPPAGVPSSVPPTATEVDPNIAHGSSTGFSWVETSPGFFVDGVRFYKTDFSAEWTGYIYLSNGTTYYFQLKSDDGSWLYINTTPGSSNISVANLMIENGGKHSARSATSAGVTVPSSGNYAIEVDYYETCGGKSGIDLSWATGSPNGFTIIPSAFFTPALIGSNAATMRATKTTISCSPKSAAAGSSTVITCTAKVTGYLPTGKVSWSQSGTGSVSLSSTTCTLVSASLTQGTCSVTMTGSTTGQVTMTATYAGDPNNQSSSRTAKLTIKA
jgi:hypothetical protein